MPDKLIVRATEHSTYPNPRRTKLVGRHVGLTQAYELRDTASEQANELRDCPATSLEDKATRAQALRNLASVWEVASDRIRIIKNKPMPGSLRPIAKPKKVRSVSTKPLETLPQGEQSKDMGDRQGGKEQSLSSTIDSTSTVQNKACLKESLSTEQPLPPSAGVDPV